MYFLGALLLFSERMSLSIKGENQRQQSLIVMFMLSLPLVIIYKTTAIIIIYANLSKFQAIEDMREFFENDIIFDSFTNIAYYTGVVCAKEMTPITFFQTVVPELLIGACVLSLNYVSSNKIGEEYMNKQDVLQEKSLVLGSTSLSILLILSVEYLAVVNISWIGLIFQIFVLITVSVFPFKRLFIIDLICLITIFLSAGQLILLFMHELPLIPMENLTPVYHFIGVDQDKSKISAMIHASGAISVFIIGIVYLRSRRLDEISAMFEFDYSDDENKKKSHKLVKKATKEGDQFKLLDFIDEDNEGEGDSTDEEDEDNKDEHLIWRIYDKIIDAVTSQFIVLNLCRLGLV